MPHLTVEYTSNLPDLDVAAVLSAANEALLESGQFEEPDIKSRAIRFDFFAVGTQAKERGFIHAKQAILSGRTPETKRELSRCLLRALEEACTCPKGIEVQTSVEVLEIDRDSYSKAAISAGNS